MPAVRVPRRQLTDAHARRIKDRDLAGYDRLREAAIALAAERGLTTAWWRGTCRRIRPGRQLTARPTAALNYPKINPRRVSSLSLLDPK